MSTLVKKRSPLNNTRMCIRTRQTRHVRRTVVRSLALTVLSAIVPFSSLSAQKAKQPATVAKTPIAATTLVLTDVTVIDVTNGQRLPAQTVVVAGHRILSLGAAKTVRIPPGARVVNAKGLFVIPGLWDMHAHVDSLPNELYPRFLAYGVTRLREMAQRFSFGTDSFRVWQGQIEADTRIGPRVFGPSADLMYEVSIETPDDAVRIVDSLKAAGALFLKVHDDGMAPALYFAVAREARKIGIPFVGHIPDRVTEVQASDSGQRSVEHVEENHSCWPNWPRPLDSLAAQRCEPVAKAYVRNGTWMVPTLAGAKYVDGNVPLAQKFVGMMHHWGVKMLTGTDIAANYMLSHSDFQPGLSILDEVTLLAGSGLTPLEALQAGTLNPAQFFHATDSLGTIAPGKLADMVLLDADPLTNIENVRKIRAVVANGRYFDRGALDTLLSNAQSLAP